MSTLHVTDDPRVGTELAGYRIESLLGVGGMSVVYLAEDLRLKRRVALKLLASSLVEDQLFRDRFLGESELAASIDHPNIVPIYEAGTTDDLLFIAMRYVEGRDLKQRLQRGPLDSTAAIGILTHLRIISFRLGVEDFWLVAGSLILLLIATAAKGL